MSYGPDRIQDFGDLPSRVGSGPDWTRWLTVAAILVVLVVARALGWA